MSRLSGWLCRVLLVGVLLARAEAANAADYEPVEFADWNAALQSQNWRVLLASREQRTLGAFLGKPPIRAAFRITSTL
jgi:hypothetical protein